MPRVLPEANDIVALVVQGPHSRQGQPVPSRGEEADAVFSHSLLDGACWHLLPGRQQLVQGAWLKHIARQDVRTWQ